MKVTELCTRDAHVRFGRQLDDTRTAHVRFGRQAKPHMCKEDAHVIFRRQYLSHMYRDVHM